MKTALLFVAAAITTSLVLYRRRRKALPSEPAETAIKLRETAGQKPGLNSQPIERTSDIEPAGGKPNRDHIRPGRSEQQAYPNRPDLKGVPFGIEFSYLDGNGQYTRRAVSVQSSDPEFFAGHCHLRDGYRTFAWDNITGFVLVADTKEVVEVDEARTRLAFLTYDASVNTVKPAAKLCLSHGIIVSRRIKPVITQLLCRYGIWCAKRLPTGSRRLDGGSNRPIPEADKALPRKQQAAASNVNNRYRLWM